LIYITIDTVSESVNKKAILVSWVKCGYVFTSSDGVSIETLTYDHKYTTPPK